MTVIIVLITSAFSLNNLRKQTDNQLKSQYIEKSLESAKHLGMMIKNDINIVQEKLNILSQNTEVMSTSTEECSKKLESIFNNLNKKVDNLGRMNKKGIFDCSVNKNIIGLDGKQFPHLDEIIKTHKPVFGDIFFSPTDKRYVTSLHIPLENESGEFIGTLGGAVYFDELGDKYLKGAQLSENGFVMVLDQNGNILYHPEKDHLGEGLVELEKKHGGVGMSKLLGIDSNSSGGFVSDVTYDGINYLTTQNNFEVFPGKFWDIIFFTPKSDIKKSVEEFGVDYFLKQEIGLISIVVLSVFIFIFFYVIFQIFKPISKITEIAEEIKKGNLDTRVEPKIVNRKDEIGRLGQTFNKMSIELQDSKKKI